MPKGQFVLGYKWIYFLVALFLLTFIFLYLNSAFRDYQTEKVQCTDTALEEIMIAKFLYGECFTYVEPEIDRTLPGTVDISKFSQKNLEECFTFITKKVNITIEGKSIGGTIYDSVTINKTLWVYENNEHRTATVQFMFEEPAC
ncbi:MAG: hypothetical protein Q8R18_05425 [bacterium]|nr:hypothetical protein [bacterium]